VVPITSGSVKYEAVRELLIGLTTLPGVVGLVFAGGLVGAPPTDEDILIATDSAEEPAEPIQASV